MEWYEKVNDLMKKENINQRQLSRLSGITECSISRYLKGNKRPRMDIILNIAKALRVDPNYFLKEEEKFDTPFSAISTAIARNGNLLSPEEKNKLIAFLLEEKGNV